MIIKELILISFGKFKNKRIVLKNGINIIYDENETGKTTVHKFIKSMFCSSFKSYTPIDAYDYHGVLKYQHLDDIYRVEKKFSKEESELKVFDDKTGEEFTNVFKYKKTPSFHNRHVFNKIIESPPLYDKKGEEALIRSKVIANLENKKQESFSLIVKNNEYIMHLEKLKKDLEQLIKRRNKLVSNVELHKKSEKNKAYCQIRKIESEIEELEKNIEIDLDSEQISTQEYNDILKINEKINLSKQHLQNITRKQENIKREIDKRFKELKRLGKLNLNDSINFNIYNYENKQIKLTRLKEGKNSYNENNQKPKITEIKKRINKFKNIKLFIMYSIFVISVLGLLNYMLFSIAGALTLILIVIYIKTKKLKKRRLILEQLIEKTLNSEYELVSEIDKVEQEMCDILDRHSVKDFKELKEKSNAFEKQKKLSYEITSYEKQKNEIDNERAKLTRHYQNMKLDLSYLLEQNNLKCVNQLSENIEKKEKYKDIIPILESKKHIINHLKSKNDIDKTNKGKKTNDEHKEVCKQISDKKLEIKEIEDKIKSLETSVENIVTLQEKINKIKNKTQIANLQPLEASKDRFKKVEKVKDETIEIMDKTGRFIELSYLSSETISQLMKNDTNFPCILNKIFIQYDDAELKDIIKVLYKESLKRQIIIFTSKKREIEILRKLNFKYSLVKL